MQYSGIQEIYGQMGGTFALGRCAFCDMCSGIPHIYDQLEGAAHLMGTGHVNMSECQDDLM